MSKGKLKVIYTIEYDIDRYLWDEDGVSFYNGERPELQFAKNEMASTEWLLDGKGFIYTVVLWPQKVVNE